MQKLFLVIFTALFFAACSTSPNNNEGSTTTVVPIAPSNLTGIVLPSSSVSLSWVDNSTNETGFKIERRVNGTTQFSVVGTVNADVTGFTDVNLSPNTSYEYRIYSFNAVGSSITYSNTIVLTTLAQAVIPTITTSVVGSVTNNSALSGGNVISDGGGAVTSKGVVWSTSTAPTLALNTKTIDGTGTGVFTSNLTGLMANTTYYVRAYATNNIGTAYGNEISFTTSNTSQPYSYTNGPNVTDIDGNIYPSIVTSCGQTWASKNLSVSRYKDGTVIPQVTDATTWANLTTGAWCYYNNDPSTEATYGRLYNWYAVNDSRGLAPQGWHVPSDAEWNKLTICIDPAADTTQCCSNAAGTAMKHMTGWNSFGNGTNSSGFAGRPGGLRGFNGSFFSVGNYGDWWSASEYGTTNAWGHSLNCYDSSVNRDYISKSFGFSLRVVRD